MTATTPSAPRVMLVHEQLSIAYFAMLGVTALSRARATRQVVGALAAAGAVFLIWGVARGSHPIARAWASHLYLLLGYWIPALLVLPSRQIGGLERWLVRTDARWRHRLMSLPHATARVLEFAYLFCYVMVPVAFVVTWTLGSAPETERFWTSVLLAGFLCYGTLPWLVSRPPRLVHAVETAPRSIARLNVFVLARLSHGLNTFPSGHVAVSVAAALATCMVSWPAGVVLTALACGIAAGAAAGGYHYVTDVLLGAVIGTIAVALAVYGT